MPWTSRGARAVPYACSRRGLTCWLGRAGVPGRVVSSSPPRAVACTLRLWLPYSLLPGLSVQSWVSISSTHISGGLFLTGCVHPFHLILAKRPRSDCAQPFQLNTGWTTLWHVAWTLCFHILVDKKCRINPQFTPRKHSGSQQACPAPRKEPRPSIRGHSEGLFGSISGDRI